MGRLILFLFCVGILLMPVSVKLGLVLLAVVYALLAVFVGWLIFQMACAPWRGERKR